MRLARGTAVGALAGAALVVSGCASESLERQLEREREREQMGPIPSYAAFVANLDFEAGEENEGDEHEPAVAWKGGGASYEFALERQGAHSGKYAARLRKVREVQPPNDFGTVTQCADASPFRGTRVKFSGWIRTDAVENGWAALYLRIDGAGVRPLLYESSEDHAARATTGWTQYAFTVDVPANAAGMCYGMVMTGTGTAWVDDLKFERVAPGR